ncbi:MAG: DUF2490 domain-containing protein [Prevotella sp.]|nr:DUF2490 domain-containing protein [Prevotella sp.]
MLLFCCLYISAQQQETNYGLSLSVELEKKLSRFFDLKAEEEVRLLDNEVHFDRSVTTVGIDYSLFDRKLKLGAYYAFLYLYNSDRYFEPRHRYYFNVSYKESFEPFTFSWRGRVQGTCRDESTGEYKINPKYVMKNKFQVDYAIWGRPWTPFISCDLYNDLNNPKGNYLTRIRYQAGVSWRLNRTDYLDFFARYDHELDRRDPLRFSVGAAWKMKY